MGGAHPGHDSQSPRVEVVLFGSKGRCCMKAMVQLQVMAGPRAPRVQESANALIVAVLLTATSQPAHAADFFAGKTINLIAGTDVGGGFSIYARLIGKHISRYIPGNPTIIVRNMPGAGGATAATYLYR